MVIRAGLPKKKRTSRIEIYKFGVILYVRMGRPKHSILLV
jgi:hypothetical protein